MSVLAVKLRDLEDLDLPDLRARWQHYYNTAAAASMSRQLLRLAVGYKMQEEVSGGLSRRALLHLSTLKTVSGTASFLDSSNLAKPRPMITSSFLVVFILCGQYWVRFYEVSPRLYCTASAMWAGLMAASPAKSAMVLATFKMR